MISVAAHGLEESDSISEMPATASELRMTPESTSVSTLAARPASRNNAAMATMPPATPHSGSTHGCRPAMPKKMLITAPSAAIADTPSVPGSASGLRRYDCIAAPDMPSAKPITMPSRARGTRSSTKTMRVRGS